MMHYHLIVTGDVQGVGFRYFVQQNALLYNICGWVRNNYDGTVEIDAEGNAINMDEFLRAIKRGSRYSTVEGVDVDRVTEFENYQSFKIRLD